MIKEREKERERKKEERNNKRKSENLLKSMLVKEKGDFQNAKYGGFRPKLGVLGSGLSLTFAVYDTAAVKRAPPKCRCFPWLCAPFVPVIINVFEWHKAIDSNPSASSLLIR